MNSLIVSVRKLYALAVRLASTLQSPFLLFVRLYWGVQLAQNGWGKLHNLERVTQFFSSLGLPAPGPTAAFVSTIEFLGGILLAIGLLSRLMGERERFVKISAMFGVVPCELIYGLSISRIDL